VDPDAFAYRERTVVPGAPVRLLTVARLTEKKGIGHALRAVARVRDRFPRLRYDIVGDGPLGDGLRALSRSLGLEDRVTFHGARTEAFVRRTMREADVFLLPSVTAADGDQEGTPTVLL
jgi:colanic acid/amylovoran biosynthesis glycosyltransferase